MPYYDENIGKSGLESMICRSDDYPAELWDVSAAGRPADSFRNYLVRDITFYEHAKVGRKAWQRLESPSFLNMSFANSIPRVEQRRNIVGGEREYLSCYGKYYSISDAYELERLSTCDLH